MNYAYEIRRQAEAAPRAALPAVTAALWKAFGEGHLSEAEAEALSGLIEAKSIAPTPVARPRKAVGSRPRTDASMERRRRWAASGRLPPGLAARFTVGEQAVLAIIAVETVKRGDCRLCHEHVAATAGVSRSTVKAALRQARMLGLVTIEERRLARFRNDTNVVRITSREWAAWLRLARSDERSAVPHQPGGGVKLVTRTNTPVSYAVNLEGWRERKGCRKATGDRSAGASPQMHEPGIQGISRAG
ncbi:helix-turn-helix domain-containing protein [Methylobacterium sp. WL30]|uniref:helix-turn-helix domain-containing protein n=1 Tax=unclassified Methylobacterium TaxID=2615210 RepID=UPI0011CA6C81|nr:MULTISPECIES: helix-turn-helix domain-containing protein [unclassified Methylobacterium]TXN40728.1 helix-turn-helix domain-containing protein [Methylobacterium sp. WL93]TXN64972.1 helix-turn-helix domain-containing protein [Methylobacterium sp. WL30]